MADSHRAPKQWVLTKNETVNSFESWRQNLQYTLALDPNFAPFLVEGSTWKEKNRTNPLRGFTDDADTVPEPQRKTAQQKVALLDLMLGQIANFCPVISRNSIIKSSTSIDNIWQIIRLHFGFHPSGARFLDLSDIHLDHNERPEDLFQRIQSFIDDNLLTKDCSLTHHGEKISEDEEISPTLENLIVLIWLRLIHPELPRLVKQRYGTELRFRTLASIKPEISLALDSLLNELQASHDAKVLRASASALHGVGDRFRAKPRAQPDTRSTRPPYRPSQSKPTKICPLCQQASRSDVHHYLSSCPFLPEHDRKFIARARALTISDCDDGDVGEYDSELTDPYVPNQPVNSARRVAITQSPYLDVFYGHHAARIIIDLGATGNLMRVSFAKYIGAPIIKSTQSAHQADGQSSLNIVGETKIHLTRDSHTLILEALVVETLDSDILGGSPFMEANDISIRPARREVTLADGSVYTYCSTDSSRMSHSVRRMQAHVLRGPTQTTTIWPGEYIELPLPDTMFPNDDSFAIEPRSDCAKSPSHNPEIMWPTPSLITSVGGKIRIPNLTEDPVIIQRNSHFCQVRHITVPTPCDNFPCPKLSSTQTGESLDSTCDIRIDPDNILPCDVQDKFGLLHQDYNTVFRRKIQAYNGMSGPIKGEVNMGPTEPPQRKGRLPLYCRDKLVELQEKFDELEEMGVFRRPEDINISVEYLNPSFLVRKPNGGFRLVTAFADVGRYSKPQPSLMPDVDSTLRTIARWKHIITTDLTKAFYQIPLSNKSMKYCGVVTPFRGVRVYARCAMGMPGSETALEELMCRVLGELLKDGVVAKIADDLYCGGDTPEELFHNWQAVLSALHANNLTLAGGKTVINPKSTVILGWVWQQGTLQASSHRIATLSSCDAPKSVRGLRSYLGAYKVLARVLPNCAKLIAPLEAVIGGHASSDLVPWTSELRDLFAASQAALSKCRVITLPLPSDQLWIVTDGAVKEPGLGSTLYVSHNNKVFIAGFFSAKLRKHQVTWLPCEIEALCIAASVKHFSPYIVQSTLKACVLTDSKPCVQAYEKLCRGEFSSSPRVSTFLSVASRFQTSIRHVSGAANVVSDFASRNAPECHEPNCQVCNFVIRTEDSVVRAVSVQEVLQGSIRLPFTSRAAWLLTQRDCPDLRRTQAHLRQGTRPSRKITDVRDVKRYLQVAQITRDGLLVVSRAEPLSPAHECIIIPRQVLDGLLSALHLKLNHPTRHQLKTVMSRYFYALDLDKAIERVSGACHLCASLQRIPDQIVEQTSLDPPETVGVTLSADIIKRARQLILVLRECVTSYTIASLVTDETHHSLRDALVSLCIELRPVGGPPAVIRTDPAPGFVTLQDDSVLRKYNITLEIGRVKNPNKNPVADKGIQELEHELQRLEPSGGPITRLTLSIAVSHLNTRIRGRGLSAREMMFQRDQFNNRQIPVHDRELILQQHHQRTANHHHSAVSKSPHGVLPSAPDIDVGSLVYLHNDGNKHQARPRYLVTEIDGPWCSIKKFTGNQLRSTSYRVKRSECYIVPSNVPSPPSDSYGLVMGPSDNHVEQSVVRGPPVPPTPPVPPGIPREISLPAVTGVTDGGDHVPQVSCPRPVPPEPPDFAAGDPAVQPPECGEEISSVDSTMMSSHSPDVASAVLDSSALDTATPRRSSRPTHKPSYLQDYVCD